MNLVVLSSYPYHDDPRLQSQIFCFRDAGYSVSEFSLFESFPNTKVYSAVWQKLLQRCSAFVKFRLAGHRLKKNLERASPDIIIAHEIEALIALSRLSWSDSPKLIFDAHEWYENQRQTENKRQAYIKKKFAAALPLISAIHTVSDGIAELYKQRVPRRIPVNVIPNIPLEPVNYDPDVTLHNLLNLPPDRKILLFHGILDTHRGLEELAKVGGKLTDNWSVAFLGDGPLSASLARMPNCYVHPRVDRTMMPSLVRSASIGALTYPNNSLNHDRGLPNKFWDFAIAGIPMISTNLSHLQHVIETHGLGVVVKCPVNAQDITAAIKTIEATPAVDIQKKTLRFKQEHNQQAYRKKLVLAVESLANSGSGTR